jgi:4-amino-4-deoxy-L-arabinose transferase-like glycosyltransferase
MARTKRKKPRTDARTKRPPLRGVSTAIREHPVLTLVVISVALGVAWMIRVRPAPFSDYLDYYNLARDLLDEIQFGYPLPTARRLPSFPALMALFMLISRSFVWLGFVNILLNAALVPVVHSLALTWSGDRRVAVTAAAICALNPTFVFFSPIIASEHLFVLLLFASFLALFSARLRPWMGAALAGALLGLAVLTRGEALFYLPVFVFAAWARAEGTLRSKIALAAVVPAACVVVLAPWLVRNHIVMGPGTGLSTTGGVNFYYGHNSNDVYGYRKVSQSPLAIADEVERQKHGYRLGMAYLRSDPSRIFGDIVAGTPILLWDPDRYAVRAGLIVRKKDPPYTIRIRRKFPTGTIPLVGVFYRVLLLFVVTGLAFYKRIGRNAYVILYGIIVMNWVCYAVVFWSKPRFRYTAEVAMCIVAAFAAHALWEFVGKRMRRRRAKAG